MRVLSILVLLALAAVSTQGRRAGTHGVSGINSSAQKIYGQESIGTQKPETERERRARAYTKLLEGQRHLSDGRRGGAGSAEALRLARQAFQEAATLDPTLAEAHTALAELAFYSAPQDFELAAREASTAARIDPDNFGARHLLSRLYALRSGLKEGNLNRTFVEQAITQLREVARLDANNAEAWALLGELYHATGRLDEALAAWARWSSAPVSTDARFFQFLTNRDLSPASAAARMGEGLLAAGRAKEAFAAIKRAIALDPDNADYGELLAQALGSGGLDDAAAIEELKRLVAVDSSNLNMVMLLARVQSRAGRVDDAAATIRASLARQQIGEREAQLLRTTLAQLYIDALRYADAVAVYEEQLKERGIGSAALASDDDKAFAVRMLRRIIDVQKRAGQSREANATIERMRQLLGRDDPTPDAEQIELLRGQRKKAEALEAARAARARHPQQPGFVRLEAQTLVDLGRADEGVALLRTLLTNTPDDFYEHLFISGLYLQAKRGTDAVAAARKALELVPSGRPDMLADALITLSTAQERSGDTKGSEESLRRILERDPSNATALNNLGYFLVERNERLTEALEMIQRAVRAHPTNASFLDSLGWAYFKLGKLDEAEKYLSEAARRNTTSVTIREHLGDLYQKRGRTEQARSAWQKALSLATEAEDILRLKAKLGEK